MLKIKKEHVLNPTDRLEYLRKEREEDFLKIKNCITSKSYIVYDMKNHEQIISYNPATKRQVASLTKIMTCLTALQLIRELKINTDRWVNVSRKAAFMIGTSASLKHNDKIKLKDIMYGLMLPSGNDAAWALAEYFGLQLLKGTLRKFDSEEKRVDEAVLTFLSKMNSNAVRLGMNHTFYANPHGLVNTSNLSTASDMAVLCSAAM